MIQRIISKLVLLALVVLATGSGVAGANELNVKQERPGQVIRPVVIQFNGEIDYQLHKYFVSRLHQLKSSGTNLIIVDINSPGGLKNESLDMAEKLRDIDWAYTVAFVDDIALSGAALVTLGCDELIISPTARLGDVGVIHFDPTAWAFRFAPQKIQSDLILEAKILAESKGRPPELVEAMIDKDVVVYQRIRGERTEFKVITPNEPPPEEPWSRVDESRPELFLTVSGVRAKELGLAQSLAGNIEELASEFGYRTADVRVVAPSMTDTIVYYLNHPVGTGCLILIGLIALFIELSAPGIGAGGLVAGLCATLFFWSRFFGGTSTWLEVLLFTAGIVFLTMELFVIPGWGVSGILGLFLVVAGIFLAGQDFVLPTTPQQWNHVVTNGLIIFGTGLTFLVAAVFITKRLGHIPVFNRLVLAPPTEEVQETKDELGKPLPQAHPDVSVGDWGIAESLLRPAGRAVFSQKSFDVVSDGSFVDAGSQVKVVQIQGNKIVVTAIDDDGLDETVHRANS